MALHHDFPQPDRFVAGTVGQPGDRTFFLQARQGNRLVSVSCEKQQVQVLAENLDRILDEVGRLTGGSVLPPPPRDAVHDNDPLDAPIDEEFRVGTMTIAWDPAAQLVVIELFSPVDEPSDLPEDATPEEHARDEAARAAEMMTVRLTPSAARDFVARSRAVVAAGRPACPFCGQPIDPAGHICPRANGYRRPLF